MKHGCKVMALVLGGILTIGSLAGCSGGAKQAEPAQTQAAATTAATTAAAEKQTEKATEAPKETTAAPAPEAWKPEKPITLVVHNAAGSGTDTVFRAWAAAAEKQLGVSIVIENIGGGAFVPAMSAIADAEPDGYTIGCITESPYYSAGYMGDYGVDLFEQLDVLLQGVENFNLLAVGADAPYNSLEEFIQYAKDHPDENISLGNSGVGGIHDITIKKLAKEAGLTNISSVAYGGASDSAAAVAGGHIPGHVAGFSPNRSLIESGHIKLIGTFKGGKERDERYPDLQSANELGYDVAGLQKWGICVPAKVEDNVKQTIHDAFKEALDDPEFVESIKVQGMLINYLNGDTLTDIYHTIYDSAAEFSE